MVVSLTARVRDPDNGSAVPSSSSLRLGETVTEVAFDVRQVKVASAPAVMLPGATLNSAVSVRPSGSAEAPLLPQALMTMLERIVSRTKQEGRHSHRLVTATPQTMKCFLVLGFRDSDRSCSWRDERAMWL